MAARAPSNLSPACSSSARASDAGIPRTSGTSMPRTACEGLTEAAFGGGEGMTRSRITRATINTTTRQRLAPAIADRRRTSDRSAVSPGSLSRRARCASVSPSHRTATESVTRYQRSLNGSPSLSRRARCLSVSDAHRTATGSVTRYQRSLNRSASFWRSPGTFRKDPYRRWRGRPTRWLIRSKSLTSGPLAMGEGVHDDVGLVPSGRLRELPAAGHEHKHRWPRPTEEAIGQSLLRIGSASDHSEC
jgi:hypothetical protein